MNFLKLSAFCLFEKKRRDGKLLYTQYIFKSGPYDILEDIEKYGAIQNTPRSMLFVDEGYLIFQSKGD